MTELKDIFELRFAGDDIKPENIRAKDLAEVISAFEDSLLKLILKDNRELNEEKIIIGLVDVENGSAKLKFKSTIPEITLSALLLISTSISKNDFSQLPSSSIRSLKTISDFTKKRNCVAEFRANPLEEKPLASINKETSIEIPDTHYIIGETSIYGRVERVGGVKPKVMIRLTDNNLISCDVSEEVAKKLGQNLYKMIGFVGKAKWLAENYSLENFEIEDVIEYEETSLLQGLDELSSLIGEYWSDVDNVVDVISSMRREKEL
ncbi:hypothetical protein MROS_0587 [Melioribacter roseus P3M-2]|uniref:Uncharacterized protein n=1 Tax=Melioribacter roseus (strain DSM 23840 / JCM 17771 / VKM B-2668 / P3M-2) TaxID=1191523 RepID=I6Z3V8_MELRP|nr:hypothetical protein [Melioribacter roseus]AFN73830.1 hypothetical protein MROS_0587 [Melioribacter roseus P3M-2]